MITQRHIDLFISKLDDVNCKLCDLVNASNANPPIEIEIGGFEACYGGIPAHIEIVRNEDGTLNKRVAHLKDNSGIIIDPANVTQIGVCAPMTPEVYNNTPQWYVGDGGSFLGYLKVDNQGNPLNWVVLRGSPPSNVGSVGDKEMGYSFTARPLSVPIKLLDFVNANDPQQKLKVRNVTSFTIVNGDDNIDLIFEISGMRTVLKQGRMHSVSYGEGQNYPMLYTWADDITIFSDAEISFSWEQVEI